MQLTPLGDLRLSQPSAAGRPAYLSAASGLVKIDSTLYVVADDELHLGAFPIACDTPGRLLRLFESELPSEAIARKQQKPDLEALVRLPPRARWPGGALLALGSGSRKQRRRAALLPLTPQGVDLAALRVLDFTAILARIETHLGEPNVEGAVVRGEQLVLMHRGNPNAADNCLISVELAALLTSIEHGHDLIDAPVVATQTYALRIADSVDLGITDGCVLSDGRLVFAAVAEDTPNSYLDGPCHAAALGVMGADGQLQSLHPLDPPYKVEGVHAEIVGSQIRAWLVTDADDPNIPAALLTATWES
jgi:hypothetical protein